LGTVKVFASFSPPIVKLRPCFVHFEPSDVYGALPSATDKNSKGFRRIIEPADYHTAGFNHQAVLPLLAGQGIKAVQSGALCLELSRLEAAMNGIKSKWNDKAIDNKKSVSLTNCLLLSYLLQLFYQLGRRTSWRHSYFDVGLCH
jgi:hypothetical protein